MGLGPPGEGDHRDVDVGGEEIADLAAGAGDDVEHARRQSRLLEDPGEQDQWDRRFGRRLGDDRVPRRQRGNDLRRHQVQRVVERAERGHRADGLPQHDGGLADAVVHPVAGDVLPEYLAHLLPNESQSLPGGLDL
jgi:hypothetical protein